MFCDRIPKDAAFSLRQLSEYIKAAGHTSITIALLTHHSKAGRAGRSSGESTPSNDCQILNMRGKKKKKSQQQRGEH